MEQNIWTIKDVLQWSVPYLKKSGSESPRLDAELLLCCALSCRRLDLYLNHDKPLESGERDSYRGMIKRRALGEPVSYITGTRDFFGFSFKVNSRVLIPRPETEHLIEEVLKGYPDESFCCLDIGTGSGCIAVSLKLSRPTWNVDAWDICSEALAVASANARNLAADVRFAQRNCLVLESWQEKARSYDLIVSNPPYIAFDERASLSHSVQGFEPHLALFSGDNGLAFYHALAKFAPDSLRDGGKIFLEIGYKQGSEVSLILERHGWREVKILPDIGGRDRVVIATRPA